MYEDSRWLAHLLQRAMAFLEDQISELDREISEKVKSESLQPAVELVQTIPGIKGTAGSSPDRRNRADMSQFPRAPQMASWVGVCPGNNESAGKRKSGRTTKGNPWARRILVECAWSGSRANGSEAKARYEHFQPKTEHKRALVAVAHWMANGKGRQAATSQAN